jgi:hypothetical protein
MKYARANSTGHALMWNAARILNDMIAEHEAGEDFSEEQYNIVKDLVAKVGDNINYKYTHKD